MEKFEVLKTDALKNGQMKTVSVKSKELLVARVDDKFYVSDASCPHLGGKLVKGKLEGTVVTCPLHGSQFDLKDGSVIQWTNWSGLFSKLSQTLKSPRPLKTYNVEIEDNTVFVSF